MVEFINPDGTRLNMNSVLRYTSTIEKLAEYLFNPHLKEIDEYYKIITDRKMFDVIYNTCDTLYKKGDESAYAFKAWVLMLDYDKPYNIEEAYQCCFALKEKYKSDEGYYKLEPILQALIESKSRRLFEISEFHYLNFHFSPNGIKTYVSFNILREKLEEGYRIGVYTCGYFIFMLDCAFGNYSAFSLKYLDNFIQDALKNKDIGSIQRAHKFFEKVGTSDRNITDDAEWVFSQKISLKKAGERERDKSGESGNPDDNKDNNHQDNNVLILNNRLNQNVLKSQLDIDKLTIKVKLNAKVDSINNSDADILIIEYIDNGQKLTGEVKLKDFKYFYEADRRKLIELAFIFTKKEGEDQLQAFYEFCKCDEDSAKISKINRLIKEIFCTDNVANKSALINRKLCQKKINVILDNPDYLKK